MAVPSSSVTPLVSPSQVWTRLAAEHQGRAVRLLVRLACNLVAAQAALPSTEACDARPVRQPQDSVRSSHPPGAHLCSPVHAGAGA
jgi:hypothetical protein